MRRAYWVIGILCVCSAYLLHTWIVEPKMDSTDFLKKYTRDEIQYFEDVCFDDKGEKLWIPSSKLKKWSLLDTLKVQIMDSCSREDSILVISTVKKFNEIPGIPVLKYSRVHGDIEIYFIQESTFFERVAKDRDLGLDVAGYANVRPKICSARLIKSKIYLNRSKTKLAKPRVERVIAHEFCHALGLLGHSKNYYPFYTILSGKRIQDFKEVTLNEDSIYTTEEKSIPRLDRKALQILYEQQLPLGIRQKELKESLSQIK